MGETESDITMIKEKIDFRLHFCFNIKEHLRFIYTCASECKSEFLSLIFVAAQH